MSKLHLKTKDDVVDDEFSMSVSDEEREQLNSKWESLSISNDFIFSKVMQNETLLRDLLRRVLPQLSISELRVDSQKSIEIGLDIHGVRLDVFAKLSDGTAVDVEMQVLNVDNLPKRMRYYSSISDMQMLEKGMLYSKLCDLYVIFICPFDLFGQKRYVYTFKNRCCESPGLELKDGVTKIVLNAKGTQNDIDIGLKCFLDYVAGKQVDDDFVKRVDRAVKHAKMNMKWRQEYMAIYMRDLENQEIGMQKGIEKGVQNEQRDRILLMLEKGKSPQAIAEFCDYPISLVNEVRDNMIAVH